MRVVYYTIPPLLDAALPFIAGMSRRVELHVIMQIHPGGWQTSMFDLEPQSLPYGMSPAAPVMGAFPPEVRSCWADTRSFQLAVFGGGHSLHPDSLRTAWQVARYIKNLDPDVLHLETAIGRMGVVLPLLNSTPLVMTVHDPEPHSGEAPLNKILIRQLNFGVSDHFILHNRSQVSLFTKGYKIRETKASVVQLGVYYLYKHYSENSKTDDGRTVLFFGRLSPYKGLEDLFEAIPLVSREIPEARFIVAGQPIPGYEIPPKPGSGNVEMINTYISNADLARLFQQASIVVCPYRDATQSAVVLTAYAFDKPVIATNVGGLPEYVDGGRTGELVPPRNPAMLAGAILRMLRQLDRDPQARDAYRQAIRHKCQTDLSWETIADQTLAVYEKARLSK